MRYKFTAPCSPCANGRTPEEGETRYPITIPTDDGDIVEIEVGRVGLVKLCAVFLAMMKDDASVRRDADKVLLDTRRGKR